MLVDDPREFTGPGVRSVHFCPFLRVHHLRPPDQVDRARASPLIRPVQARDCHARHGHSAQLHRCQELLRAQAMHRRKVALFRSPLHRKQARRHRCRFLPCLLLHPLLIRHLVLGLRCLALALGALDHLPHGVRVGLAVPHARTGYQVGVAPDVLELGFHVIQKLEKLLAAFAHGYVDAQPHRLRAFLFSQLRALLHAPYGGVQLAQVQLHVLRGSIQVLLKVGPEVQQALLHEHAFLVGHQLAHRADVVPAFPFLQEHAAPPLDLFNALFMPYVLGHVAYDLGVLGVDRAVLEAHPQLFSRYASYQRASLAPAFVAVMKLIVYLSPRFCVPKRCTDNPQGHARPRKPNPLRKRPHGGYSVGLNGYRERREWDLNPRMTVLQTVALGHLAIPPMCSCGSSLQEKAGRVKQNFAFGG